MLQITCKCIDIVFFPRSTALGIDRSVDILDHIRALPTDEARIEAVAKIQAVEREAMLAQQPQPGLVELMDYLEKKNLRRALCTRNFEYVFFVLLERKRRELTL